MNLLKHPGVTICSSLLIFMMLACASTQRVRLGAGSSDQGRLVVKLTEPVRATLFLNGKVVVDNERTKEIVVDGLPPGRHQARLLTAVEDRESGLDEDFSFILRPNEDYVQAFTTPGTSKIAMLSIAILLGSIYIAGALQ